MTCDELLASILADLSGIQAITGHVPESSEIQFLGTARHIILDGDEFNVPPPDGVPTTAKALIATVHTYRP